MSGQPMAGGGPTFVIFTPEYNDDVGGVIALHRLCDLLNGLGHRARLWPKKRPLFDRLRPFRSGTRLLRYALKQRPFRTFDGFDTPLATPRDLCDAIVVYPEVIAGNPLRARRVVRWFLHKPGFHSGRVDYGRDELYFFFQHSFNDSSINPNGSNLLQVYFIRDDIYQQRNFGGRSGYCHILRKGRGRPPAHDIENSILIDGLSHTEAADVFNRCEYCVSYDLYTMYSQFAALCGCTSVVVPEPGLSKAEWHPNPEEHHGLAYGFDDIDQARASLPLLLPTMKKKEREANRSVVDFVARCRAHFDL
jgi:hypothetical protein